MELPTIRDYSPTYAHEHLEGVIIRNAETAQSRKVATQALFIMVCAAPNTDWLSGLVKLDDKGFVERKAMVGLKPTSVGIPRSPIPLN